MSVQKEEELLDEPLDTSGKSKGTDGAEDKGDDEDLDQDPELDPEDDDEEDVDDEDVDYKALLEQEQSKSKNLHRALKKERSKRQEEEGDDGDEEEEVVKKATKSKRSDDSLSSDDIRSIIRQEKINDYLEDKVPNAQKRELILAHLQNRIKPTSSYRDDVDLAIYSVNKRIQEAQAEARGEARAAKKMAELEYAKNNSQGNFKNVRKGSSGLTSEDIKIAKQAKMSPKRYKELKKKYDF